MNIEEKIKNFEKNAKKIDMFGNEIITAKDLRELYGEPPFSVLNGRSHEWILRKRAWLDLGIKGHISPYNNIEKKPCGKQQKPIRVCEAVFDPVLCEIIYKWFAPEGGLILDPFAGGAVRGIVAGYLGYEYIGIEIRREQIEQNLEQVEKILTKKENKQPVYIEGDSRKMLDVIDVNCDLIFSCPPYHDLEVYSDMKEDLSAMNYEEFLQAYRDIIRKCEKKLKIGGYACFVVSEIRNKYGYYKGFVMETIKAFTETGLKFYNDAIFLLPVATASIRSVEPFEKARKLTKIHENVLIFKKNGKLT